jgi:hypothetical protein
VERSTDGSVSILDSAGNPIQKSLSDGTVWTWDDTPGVDHVEHFLNGILLTVSQDGTRAWALPQDLTVSVSASDEVSVSEAGATGQVLEDGSIRIILAAGDYDLLSPDASLQHFDASDAPLDALDIDGAKSN